MEAAVKCEQTTTPVWHHGLNHDEAMMVATALWMNRDKACQHLSLIDQASHPACINAAQTLLAMSSSDCARELASFMTSMTSPLPRGFVLVHRSWIDHAIAQDIVVAKALDALNDVQGDDVDYTSEHGLAPHVQWLLRRTFGSMVPMDPLSADLEPWFVYTPNTIMSCINSCGLAWTASLLALQSESTVAHFMTMIPDADASQVLALMKAQANPQSTSYQSTMPKALMAMMAQHQQDDPTMIIKQLGLYRLAFVFEAMGGDALTQMAQYLDYVVGQNLLTMATQLRTSSMTWTDTTQIHHEKQACLELLKQQRTSHGTCD